MFVSMLLHSSPPIKANIFKKLHFREGYLAISSQIIKRFLTFPTMASKSLYKNIAIIKVDNETEKFTFSLVVTHPETKNKKQVGNIY